LNVFARGVSWIVITGACLLLIDFGRRLMMPYAKPSAEDIQARDTRAPVLYLRSFERESRSAVWWHAWIYAKELFSIFNALRLTIEKGDEGIIDHHMDTIMRSHTIHGPLSARDVAQSLVSGRMVQDEQLVLAHVMNRIGPYVGVSRPGETDTWSDVGSHKLKLSSENWQDTVLRLIDESAAIVIEGGCTESLIWEIRNVVKMVPGTKVLLVAARTDEQYHEFYQIAANIFPRGLPSQRPLSRLITFSRDWRPVILDWHDELDDLSCLNALGPFIEYNGFGALFESNVREFQTDRLRP
jgi:hypothetical protein